MPVDASPLAAAAVEGRTVASQDLAGDERFDDEVKRLLGVPDHAALLAAPVVRDGENQVVVVLFRERRSFSEEDLALTRQLSGAARGALERSEHFESVSRARRLSERLAALGARLVSTLSARATCSRRPRPRHGRCSTPTRRPSGCSSDDELVVRAAAGAALEALLGTRVELRRRVCSATSLSRAAWSPSRTSALRPTPAPRRRAARRGMGAAVAVPLVAPGRWPAAAC